MSQVDNTQSINLKDPRFLAMLAELNDTEGTATLKSHKEVVLLIKEMSLRLEIRDRQVYYLGRFRSTKKGEVNLNPFGALQAGVSRVHAQIIMRDETLYIVDLDSANGTYVGKKRLPPKTPMLLHNGDEVLLGRMRIQVLFQ